MRILKLGQNDPIHRGTDEVGSSFSKRIPLLSPGSNNCINLRGGSEDNPQTDRKKSEAFSFSHLKLKVQPGFC